MISDQLYLNPQHRVSCSDYTEVKAGSKNYFLTCALDIDIKLLGGLTLAINFNYYYI